MKEKRNFKLGRNKLVALSLAAIISVGVGSVNAAAVTEASERERGISYGSIWDELLSEQGNGDYGQYEDEIINLDRNYLGLASVANKNVSASAIGCAKHNPSNPNFIGNKNTRGKKKNPCRAAARTVPRNARPMACK